MTTISRNRFIEAVRAMAGLPASPAGAPDGESARFNNIISLIALQETSAYLRSQPATLAECSSYPVQPIWRCSSSGVNIGLVPLPSDCLRPIGVSCGTVELRGIIYPDSESHWQRFSAFPEISGNVEKPKIYYVAGSSGNSLEIHGAAAQTEAKVLYVPIPDWNGETLTIPSAFEPELVSLTTARIQALLT